jgi:hypothetical protein
VECQPWIQTSTRLMPTSPLQLLQHNNNTLGSGGGWLCWGSSQITEIVQKYMILNVICNIIMQSHFKCDLYYKPCIHILNVICTIRHVSTF